MNETASDKHEVRKLQLTGGSTYIISLPKNWVSQMGIGKGSKLTIAKETDGSLLIMPESLKKVEESTEAIIEVVPDEDSDSIIRKIVAAYLVGYNMILVKARSQRLEFAQRNAIMDFTRKMLVGTEIIADSSKEITMKVLLSYPELSIQSALRRMCIITASMHKDVILSLKELDKDLARSVINIDDEVDRFNLYIIRQLKAAVENERIIKEIGLASRRDCLGYRLITKVVERTADHAVEIAENVLLLKKPLETKLFEQIASMSTAAISVFDETVESLFKHDFDLANNIVQKAKQVTSMKEGLINSILKRTDMSEVSSLSLVLESITRVAEYASDIAEIVLNLNINQIIAP